MKLNVDLEQGSTSWGASTSSKAIGGLVVAVAETREEALAEFRSALKFHIDGLRESGTKVPRIDGLIIRELVPA